MDKTAVFAWNMHAAGSQISFSATGDDTGYDLVVKRNDALVVADVAPDGVALLRKSRDLRALLQELGYSASAIDARQAQLPGRICWGPAPAVAWPVVQALSHART